MRSLVVLVCAFLTPHLGGCGGNEPSPDPNLDPRAVTSDGQSYQVTYTPTPDPIPLNAYFSLELEVRDSNNALVTNLPVDVHGWMPDHGHGMNTVPTITPANDRYQVEGMLFHMEMGWEIRVDIGPTDRTERAVFEVMCCDVPSP